MPVQNMLLYPGHEYAHYEASAGGGSNLHSTGNSIQQNAALMLGSLAGGGRGGSATGGSSAGSNAAATEPSYPFFSLRPLIDSIFEVSVQSRVRQRESIIKRTPAERLCAAFERRYWANLATRCAAICIRSLIATISLMPPLTQQIPISTLRAVNNLVGRLTGSYRQASGPEMVQKSVSIDANTPLRLPPGNSVPLGGNFKLSTTAQRQPPMREELA